MTDTNTTKENTVSENYNPTPIPNDPATLAFDRVTDAVDLVQNGPKMIAEAYEMLTTEVTRYTRAYDILTALDATGTAPVPDTLPGVKAVKPVRRRKRRTSTTKAA